MQTPTDYRSFLTKTLGKKDDGKKQAYPESESKTPSPRFIFFGHLIIEVGGIKEFVLSLHMMTENTGALRAGYVIRRGLFVQKHTIHHGK